mmetsp:Transcript_13202/g.36253  ORF Transcript_13202/g.36253 Transcript_13202/m.36253 type:complete len:389 (-) Transcript_13202:1552-2718(-)
MPDFDALRLGERTAIGMDVQGHVDCLLVGLYQNLLVMGPQPRVGALVALGPRRFQPLGLELFIPERNHVVALREEQQAWKDDGRRLRGSLYVGLGQDLSATALEAIGRAAPMDDVDVAIDVRCGAAEAIWQEDVIDVGATCFVVFPEGQRKPPYLVARVGVPRRDVALPRVSRWPNRGVIVQLFALSWGVTALAPLRRHDEVPWIPSALCNDNGGNVALKVEIAYPFPLARVHVVGSDDSARALPPVPQAKRHIRGGLQVVGVVHHAVRTGAAVTRREGANVLRDREVLPELGPVADPGAVQAPSVVGPYEPVLILKNGREEVVDHVWAGIVPCNLLSVNVDPEHDPVPAALAGHPRPMLADCQKDPLLHGHDRIPRIRLREAAVLLV